MTTARIVLPRKLVPVFGPPRGAASYRAAWGGRGSGKSYSFALMAAVWGYAEPLRILATREFQASIKESFHAELKAAIASQPWLEAHYDVGVDYLRGRNGTEFIFRGLRHNIANIKSLAKIDLTIVEEAEDVPEASWLALEATVFRQPRSELWAIWNPRVEGSPVDSRFRLNPPASALTAEMNWQDNPFFPPGLAALREREQERLDPGTYAHVWEGAYRSNSDAQVFRHVREGALDVPPGTIWRYGADWGFAADPTAAVRCCILGDDTLYIDAEAYGFGVPTEALPALLAKLPGAMDWPMRGDSARPETIDYLRRHGFPKLRPARKGKGSVEDGIEFLRGFQVVINPACPNALREFRGYSYRTDPLTGEALPLLQDGDEHLIDATRYALEGVHRRGHVLPVPDKLAVERLPRPRDYDAQAGDDVDNWKVA